jgi:hypothetical protein
MPLLTDEQWNALARQIAERLDGVAPGWTDHRDADPGVTLLQVFAFLAEDLVFRAKTMPEPARHVLDRTIEQLEMVRARTCVDPTPPVRVRYFDGQLLTRDDLQTEQDYLRAKHRRHNLLLHGIGIVTGLEVAAGSQTGSDEPAVTVSPGVAIAPDGEEILLCEPFASAIRADSDACYVVLRVTDVERSTVSVDATNQASRVQEVVQITLEAHVGDGGLAIARLVQEDGGWIVDGRFRPQRCHVR